MKRVLLIVASVLGLISFSSCAPLVAGAAGGYFLHKEGYRVQNPIKKADVRVQAPVVKQPNEPYTNPNNYVPSAESAY